MTSFDLNHSVAFVTGTNKERGIGRAVVHALLKAGVQKIYATARDVSQLDGLVREAKGKVVPVALDVTDTTSLQKLNADFPDVNLVVNNAGTFGGSSALENPEAAAQEIAVNYYGPLRVAQAFAPQFSRFKSQGDIKGSALVNVNSIVSFVNFPVGATYSASKAAAHSLTQAQRRELKDTLVIGVYPGPIDTEMGDGLQMEKVAPQVVAEAIVEALKNGHEDVFPDPTSAQVHAAWRVDAKALEIQLASSAMEAAE